MVPDPVSRMATLAPMSSSPEVASRTYPLTTTLAASSPSGGNGPFSIPVAVNGTAASKKMMIFRIAFIACVIRIAIIDN